MNDPNNPTDKQSITKRPSRRTEKTMKELKGHYHLGQKASRRTRTKNGKPKYKEAAITKFATKHRTTTSPVYLARQFAETFDQEELDRILKLSTELDFPIGISHIGQLVRVHDAELRQQLTRQLAVNRWTLKQLMVNRREAMKAHKK